MNSAKVGLRNKTYLQEWRISGKILKIVKSKMTEWTLTTHHCAMCVCSLSCVWLFAAPWTVTRKVPLSMGFSRQESWNGLPFPTPGDLLNPEIKPVSLTSPVLAGGFCMTEEAPILYMKYVEMINGVGIQFNLFFWRFFDVYHFLKSLLNFLQYCFCFTFWFFGSETSRIFGPQPGIEPTPPA